MKNNRRAGSRTISSPVTPAGRRQDSPLFALQEEVNELLRDVRHPRVGAVLALMEEVGELAHLVTEREVYGQTKVPVAALGAELADILILLCELSAAYRLDLGREVGKKLRILAPKIPRWREKYGPHLKKVRRQWD